MSAVLVNTYLKMEVPLPKLAVLVAILVADQDQEVVQALEAATDQAAEAVLVAATDQEVITILEVEATMVLEVEVEATVVLEAEAVPVANKYSIQHTNRKADHKVRLFFIQSFCSSLSLHVKARQQNATTQYGFHKIQPFA